MGLRSRPRWVKDEEEWEAGAHIRAELWRMRHTNLRLVVCGGRDYADKDFVWATLDRVHRLRGIAEIIEGGATGADKLAGEWADARGVKRHTERADWKAHGKSAGPKRNAKMIRMQPHGVIAFPGGAGTADCIWWARAACVPVWEPPVDSLHKSCAADLT